MARLTFLVYGSHFRVFPHVALFIPNPIPMHLEIDLCVRHEDLMWQLSIFEYCTMR